MILCIRFILLCFKMSKSDVSSTSNISSNGNGTSNGNGHGNGLPGGREFSDSKKIWYLLKSLNHNYDRYEYKHEFI